MHALSDRSPARKRTSARVALFAAVGTIALSGTLLAGCASSGSDQQILDKLNQMEDEIAQLKGDQNGASGTASAPDGGSDAASSTGTDGAATGQSATDQNASAASGTATSSATDLEAAIADFESRASAAVQTADAVAVPNDFNQRPQAYFDATAPLETLEHEADQLDYQLEASYRQGAIDANALWTLDNRLDAAEDSLDAAKDRLELRMGVDD